MTGKKSYRAKAPFTLTLAHGEAARTFHTGDKVPEEFANHWFGKAHVELDDGSTPDVETSVQAFIDAEVDRRVALERERIEAEAKQAREEFARNYAANPPADPVRDEVTERQAEANATSIATGETVKGSTGDPKQQEKDLQQQAETAGTATRRGRNS